MALPKTQLELISIDDDDDELNKDDDAYISGIQAITFSSSSFSIFIETSKIW